MSKKRLIAMFVSLVVIIILCVLGGAVFVVQDIQIVIESGDDIEIANEEIIKTANISYGKSIFAISESKVVSNIEGHFPTLKVRGIERVFPNKIILKIAERVPIIAIKFEGKQEYLILDNNMCAIAKINAPDENYLKEICVVTGFELSGSNDIFLGKQLPTSYGEQTVVCQHVMAGLNAKMGLEKMEDFMCRIEFSPTAKVVYVVTRFNGKDGVSIKLAYDTMKDNKLVVFERIKLAYEFYNTLDTKEKSEGFILRENDEFLYKVHE